MQQTKEKAPCTVAAVQNACNEPTKAQNYFIAIEPKSQIFRGPERIVDLYKHQIAASGEEVSENGLQLIECVAQFVHRAYQYGFADGQKGGDLHGE